MANDEPAGQSSSAVSQNEAEPPAMLSLKAFLETVPPSQSRLVTLQTTKVSRQHGGTPYYRVHFPALTLHCPNASCGGARTFRCTSANSSVEFYESEISNFVDFICFNCHDYTKRYSLHVKFDEKDVKRASVEKYGEVPSFGVPTPTRLLELLGDDREMFLKGRRCENQGLGIGAFAYYRRVVERRKNEIIDEILKVAVLVDSGEAVITALNNAKDEVQFSKAMKDVRDGIPESLLMRGQNPLSLLHSALSVGIHELTDERCLELAHDVRVVLSELAERISTALKDERELSGAVSRLAGTTNPQQAAKKKADK